MIIIIIISVIVVIIINSVTAAGWNFKMSLRRELAKNGYEVITFSDPPIV